jgi:hypothetical protein
VEFSNERGVNMGFTSILALIVIAILIIVINVVIQGMKNKKDN